MTYTVPWFPELGDRQIPGKAWELTKMAAFSCNRREPLPFKARVNLFFFEVGGALDYDLCRYSVWMALELGMVEWCDSRDGMPT